MKESPPPQVISSESAPSLTPVQEWRLRRSKKMKDLCRIALPSGSLQQATIDRLNQAGYAIDLPERALSGRSRSDPELAINFYRSMEIPAIVAQGYADIGITGKDMVDESALQYGYTDMTQKNILPVACLNYAKNGGGAWWVLAVNNESKIQSVEDLLGGRIESEVPYLTMQYCKDAGLPVRVASSFDRGKEIERLDTITIVPSFGATEGKTEQIGDAVVTVTETSKTLIANNLRVIGKILRTCVALILNVESRKQGWGRKAKEIAILMFDEADVEGWLEEDFDRDSRKPF